jgi:nucleoside-diphosphate-sugar epimerase
MSTHPALVTGGCGFVGRHVVARFIGQGQTVWVIDDLSTGRAPAEWLTKLGLSAAGSLGAMPAPLPTPQRYTAPAGGELIFLNADVRTVLRLAKENPGWLPSFGDTFHLAAVVGGRAKIDGDPLSVATDLAIDADFFNWAVRERPARILYPSSSAAYPVHLQEAEGHVLLKEEMIDFASGRLGMPDMTYGWAKLTGEYLARIAAERYDLHVACVRPFSGYGEDQEESYPVPAIAGRAARQEDPLTVWGSGKQGRDFVHIEDVVDAMFRTLEVVRDGSGVNIGSGRLTTFLEVAELFASLAGYRPTIQPLIDKPVGVQARYGDATRARTQLGWQPAISMEEGFRRVLAAAIERNHATAPVSA